MIVLVDTSVLIDVLNDRRGRPEFLRDLARIGHTPASCAVTVAEVYAGMRPKEARITGELFASLQYVETSVAAARLAGELKNLWAKKGRTLALSDVMIAALALANGAAVATDNVKDFPMPELRLLDLPRPN